MSSYKIQQVTDQDILCGRGRGLESFPGNKLFRQVIKEHAASYIAQSTTRSERSRMVRLISDRLASEGMRFIKRVNKGWTPLEDYDAKLKVGHALRDAGSRLQSEESKTQAETKKRQRKDWKEMEFDQFVGVVSEDEGSIDSDEDHSTEDQQIESQISIEEVDSSMDLDVSSFPLPSSQKVATPTIATVEEKLLGTEDDNWALLPVDMNKPFQPRLSFKSISAAIPFEDFELTNDIVDMSAEVSGNALAGIVKKEDFDFDVSLSEVFLQFLDDDGESDIIAGQDINPDQWLAPGARSRNQQVVTV